MLINQNELEHLDLHTPSRDNLCAEVINQLNAIADPIRRYATARMLKSVFDKASEDTNAAAVAFCLENGIGLDNQMFVHDGLSFVFEYKCDYKWGDNDTDENGLPLGYNDSKRMIAQLEKQLDVYKKRLNSAKATIELVHPKMEPQNPRWTMKFYMKEA